MEFDLKEASVKLRRLTQAEIKQHSDVKFTTIKKEADADHQIFGKLLDYPINSSGYIMAVLKI